MAFVILRCPRCIRPPLEMTLYEGRQVDLCRRCGGLWCRPSQWDKEALGSITTIIREGQRAREEGPALPTVVRHEGRRFCPQCHERLAAWEVGGDAGVDLDRCDSCGGVWLEPGEWDQLATLKEMRQLDQQSTKPTTWNDWLWQFFLGLPVEYNVRPRRYPYVTVGLVVACTIIFAVQLFSPHTLVDDLGFRPANASGWGWLTLLSSMFLHGGWAHLVGNMYFLYVLGDNVEDALGHLGYLCFYVVCGLAAGLTWLVLNPTSTEPVVGASGAIAGIMAAYFVLFRQARLTLMVLFWQWKVHAWVWILLWFGFQVIAATVDFAGRPTGVAHLAHIGGFAAGLVIILPLQETLMAHNPILRVLRLYHPTHRRAAAAVGESGA